MRRSWVTKLVGFLLAACVLAAGFSSPVFSHSHAAAETHLGDPADHDHDHHGFDGFDADDGPALLAGSAFHLHGYWLGISLANVGTPSGDKAGSDVERHGSISIGQIADATVDANRIHSLIERIPWTVFSLSIADLSLWLRQMSFTADGGSPAPNERATRSPLLRC